MAEPIITKTANGFSATLQGAGAASGGGITVSDPAAASELAALIEQRRQLGLELSRKLIAHGLAAASDQDETWCST